MLKIKRDSIRFLLNATPRGEMPPLGRDLQRFFQSNGPVGIHQSRAPLEIAHDYYETLQDLSEKGLLQSSETGYQLTPDGKEFLRKLRTRENRLID